MACILHLYLRKGKVPYFGKLLVSCLCVIKSKCLPLSLLKKKKKGFLILNLCGSIFCRYSYYKGEVMGIDFGTSTLIFVSHLLAGTVHML